MKLYVKINNIFGFCKVFACLIVIFVGVYEICKGNTDNFKGDIFEGTKFKFGSIALAFYNGLWSYDGWSSVTTITEEIKKPEKYVCDKLNAINRNQFRVQILIYFIISSSIHRNIPRSIAIAVPIITGLYVFMNIAYMIVLEKNEMINSDAVGLTFGEKTLGSFSFLIPLGVALSTFGCALSIQFGVTRWE